MVSRGVLLWLGVLNPVAWVAVYYHHPGFNGRRGTRGVVEDAARNVNEWLAGMGVVRVL